MIVASLLLILVAVMLLVLGLRKWFERVCWSVRSRESARRRRTRGRCPPGGRRARGDRLLRRRAGFACRRRGCRTESCPPQVDGPGERARTSPGGPRGATGRVARRGRRAGPGIGARPRAVYRSDRRRRRAGRSGRRRGGAEPRRRRRPAGRAGGAVRVGGRRRPGGRMSAAVLVIDGRPRYHLPAACTCSAGRASRCRSARRSSSASPRAACASPTAHCSPTPGASDPLLEGHALSRHAGWSVPFLAQ